MGATDTIWLVMARTGGDYEYTDWPVIWRPTQEHAEAVARDFTKRIAELNAIVPPCPGISDSERRWAFYERREKRARETAEAELGVGLDASFFIASVAFDPAESSAHSPSEASASAPATDEPQSLPSDRPAEDGR
jgi:hypothetical protein